MNQSALILGCGVAGLSCGIVLAERGWEVQILAEKHWSECASGKAGGLWLPYKIEPRDRVLAWSRRTLAVLTELARNPENGVLMGDNIELYRSAVSAAEVWWLGAVQAHRRLREDELPEGYACGFCAHVPVMDVPVYMPRLEARFLAAGGTLCVTGSPVDSLSDLCEPSRLLVNCTGIGSRKLCNDKDLRPIRGQLVRTTNPGLVGAIADEHHPLGIAYVIARSQDCILGGTAEEGDESTVIDPSSRDRILEINRALAPRLFDAEVLQDIVCIRPFRTAVRLEREDLPGGTIIHNYGHGGAGFTVSWGCAEEVANLAAATA